MSPSGWLPKCLTAECNAPSCAAEWPRNTAQEQTTQLTAPSPAAVGTALLFSERRAVSPSKARAAVGQGTNDKTVPSSQSHGPLSDVPPPGDGEVEASGSLASDYTKTLLLLLLSC